MRSHGRPKRAASGPGPRLLRFGPRVAVLLFLATVLSCAGHPGSAPEQSAGAQPTISEPTWQGWTPGVDYAYLRIESLEGPIALHLIRLDLNRAQLAVRSSRSAGGTVLLEDPKQLLRQSSALFAINASPYGTETLRDGAVATISGLSLESGHLVSDVSGRLWSFYLTTAGRFGLLPPLGNLPENAVEGAGGFFPLVLDGRARGPEGPRDARTAIGRHRDGWLYVAVVDGRRWGHSRGASPRELGRWLAALGVEEALNLDGGGSSILLARNAGFGRSGIRTVNRPVGGLLYGGRRPVANVILVGEGDFDEGGVPAQELVIETEEGTE